MTRTFVECFDRWRNFYRGGRGVEQGAKFQVLPRTCDLYRYQVEIIYRSHGFITHHYRMIKIPKYRRFRPIVSTVPVEISKRTTCSFGTRYSQSHYCHSRGRPKIPTKFLFYLSLSRESRGYLSGTWYMSGNGRVVPGTGNCGKRGKWDNGTVGTVSWY